MKRALTLVAVVGVLGTAACANTFDAEIKQGMAAIAATTILLVDHTKLGQRAAIRFGSLGLIDAIVTDDGADDASVAILTDAGVRVVIANTSVRS